MAALRADRRRARRRPRRDDQLPHVERRRPDPRADRSADPRVRDRRGLRPLVPVPDDGDRRARRDGAAARHPGAAAVGAHAERLGTSYVYVFHSMVSTHMIYEPDGFDHYDTVLTVGPFMEPEIRAPRGARRAAGQGAGRARVRPARHDPRQAARRRARPHRRRSAGGAGRAVVGSELHLRDRRRPARAGAARRRLRVIARPHPMTAKRTPRRDRASSSRRSAAHPDVRASTRTSRRTTSLARVRPHGERLVGRGAGVRVRVRAAGAVRRRRRAR